MHREVWRLVDSDDSGVFVNALEVNVLRGRSAGPIFVKRNDDLVVRLEAMGRFRWFAVDKNRAVLDRFRGARAAEAIVLIGQPLV